MHYSSRLFTYVSDIISQQQFAGNVCGLRSLIYLARSGTGRLWCGLTELCSRSHGQHNFHVGRSAWLGLVFPPTDGRTDGRTGRE